MSLINLYMCVYVSIKWKSINRESQSGNDKKKMWDMGYIVLLWKKKGNESK